MIDSSIQHWLCSELNDTIERISPVSGGCICDAFRVDLKSERSVFIKHAQSNPDMFNSEKVGLEAIIKQVPCFAPQPIAVCDSVLVMEYVEASAPTRQYWEQLGEKLAQLHATRFQQFGFSTNNFCGATPQANTFESDGIVFFQEHRLRFQIDMASRRKLLPTVIEEKLHSFVERLPLWIPEQPAVLIHGDLWSGNTMNSPKGPQLVDPACYYGWAEAELAMTTLFGGFDKPFYQAYEAHAQVDKNWRERASICNLYHLLNHLNLFGPGYLSGISSTLDRYL